MKLKDLNQPAVWLFKIIAILGTILIMTMSCSVYEESLTHPTPENRNIVGYERGIIFKKRLYYKVTDSTGKPAIRIYKPEDEPLMPVGSVLMLVEEFNTHN